MIPFDFDCEFINNQFGLEKKRQINYEEFTQIIHVCVYLFFDQILKVKWHTFVFL